MNSVEQNQARGRYNTFSEDMMHSRLQRFNSESSISTREGIQFTHLHKFIENDGKAMLRQSSVPIWELERQQEEERRRLSKEMRDQATKIMQQVISQ